MAFPWLDEYNFEDGLSGFTGATDTGSAITFDHYSELARTPGFPMPYRGAYCMHVSLADVSTTAFVNEDTTFDMALAEEQHFKFRLFITNDIVMADTNEFEIFTLRSAAANEVTVALNYTTANGLRLGWGKLTGTTLAPISTGEWHTIEIKVVIDNDASDDGTIDVWIDGGAQTQVASLDQLAVTTGRMGAQAIDAGTTAGHIFFDDIITDDARLGFTKDDRFVVDQHMTLSGHAFVGPGKLDNVTLISGAGTDCVLTAYDTDVADTSEPPKLLLQNTANNEVVDPAGMPVNFIRGCYITLAGTTPQAIAKICSVNAYGSEGAIRTYALRRN